MNLADPNLEKYTLGSICFAPHKLYQAASLLSPEDFTVSAYRTAFSLLLEKGEKLTDVIPLHEALKEAGVHSLTVSDIAGWNDFQFIGDPVEYARKLKQSSLRRQAARVGESLTNTLLDGTGSPQEAITRAHEQLLELMAGNAEHPTHDAFHVANETLNQIHERRKRGDSVSGLRVGLNPLDEFTGGLNAGEFAIIAARPSIGKTSLAVQAVCANADFNRPVFVFSAEMTRQQFFARMLSQVSGVSSYKIRRSHLLSNYEVSEIDDSAAKIAEWPWYVADRSNPHVSEVVARAVTEVKRHKCELIIVDHLQKLRGDGNGATEQMTNISASLTQLAKDYAPVIALSQLARPEDHNKAKWPTMLDLRGSGMLEADAHVVIMLHREIDDQKQYTDKGWAIVEKQREGMTGAIPVQFNTELLKFVGR